MVSLLVTPPLLKPQGWNVPGGFAAARKAPIVAADSENDLPVFSMPECASRHDMRSFLHTFGHTGHFKYKDDVTIAEDATPSVSWNSV